MLRSVTLTDFQSHQHTHLSLGLFTVIVGSSSSGKSAVIRGIKLAAQNARGVSYVRQGAKKTRVSLEFANDTVVSVTRGKSVSEYELALPGADAPTLFTKCSTSTPEALVEAMAFGDPLLWLAGQFDRPFLLDETGSAVATVLGRLTNVTMIYAAVRELNRRVSEIRRKHSDQAADWEEVRSDLRAFEGLPERLAAGQRAEQACDRATELQVRRLRLADSLEQLDDAGARVVSAQTVQRVVPSVSRLDDLSGRRSRLIGRLREVGEASRRRAGVTATLRQVPNASSFEPLLTKRASLRGVLSTLALSGESVARLTMELDQALAATGSAKERFSRTLSDASNCPLCGASAAHAQVHNVV